MKRLLMLQIFAFGLVCVLGISSAAALGLGTYYSLGWGDGEIEYDDYYNSNDTIDIDTDHKNRAIGFVLDTNVAKDSLFNYRFNVAIDAIEIESERGIDIEADGFAMDHTFGFGVLRTPQVRLWIGPQINLSYYHEEYDHDGNYYYDNDFDLFGFGIGPAMGVNFNIGELFTLTATHGYKFTWLFGSDFRDDFYGYEGQYYINFGILFRINDAY